MCLSATGSPPRRTCARRSLALARAAPTSSNAVEPSVTRRLLAGEIVLDHPSPRAARAQAQSEAAELVIPESLVLRARRQHQRLGGSRCQLHEMSSSWAGHGHVRPAPSCHLLLPPHSRYGKLRE